MEKRDAKKHQVKKKEKQQFGATKAQCANKVATVEAYSFRSYRARNKTTMALECELAALKSEKTNSHGVLLEEFTDSFQQQKTMASACERFIVNQAKFDGKNNENQNLSDHYHELREEKKRSLDI